jgi:predicted amidohydrolase/GNAT superfamily N-acetyltransferase
VPPTPTNSPETEHKLVLRNLTPADYPDIKALMDRVYADWDGAWPQNIFRAQLKAFPEGQIGIEDHGTIVAAAFSLVVDYDAFGDGHTYNEITGSARLTTHDPSGDVLYGVDVFVSPDYRGMRLGRRLYEARKELCQNLNLKSIVAGGRIPGYADHKDEMTPQAYIECVKRKEIYDPILTFQLSNDFEVKRVLKDYMPDDRASSGYATLLEWPNLYYDPTSAPLIGRPRSTARVGCVQWQMRPLASVDELLQQVEFFVDALSDYQCDAALFPEFFNAPLMGLTESKSPADAVRTLAGHSPRIVDEIARLAVSYNITIIAGSMPVLVDGSLRNAAYLCRRDGTVDVQYKLHPTPHESRAWVLEGGDQLKVFDTDFGKIGVLICYDVEFPELARIQAEHGMQILFVPFWTDTKNGYLRVRLCAHARAIENECYVAIAGSVGNLPKVDGADIQYAQSAVFSPSDFAFPHDAVMAETTPNTEMTVIVDLDLDKLHKLQHEGSVRNYLDRRRDLYAVNWTGAKE